MSLTFPETLHSYRTLTNWAERLGINGYRIRCTVLTDVAMAGCMLVL
jgi:hypothetical protein